MRAATTHRSSAGGG